jgi:hypothetical protein
MNFDGHRSKKAGHDDTCLHKLITLEVSPEKVP